MRANEPRGQTTFEMLAQAPGRSTVDTIRLVISPMQPEMTIGCYRVYGIGNGTVSLTAPGDRVPRESASVNAFALKRLASDRSGRFGCPGQ